ncbi:alpha/beta hydrolase fold [Ruminococcaceae bacterium YAD3003]|nr:alpha/beta hydrolase fold [Ruminococcaceae bacterium YAD3003]
MKKNKVIKGLGIALGVIVFLGVAGSVAMGGYVSNKILHQNADKDTHDNSIKQLEVWGYDTEKFMNTYEGIEISATAEDGNVVPGTYFDSDSDKCVILVHGAGGDRVCTYPLAEQYIEDGFDVIAIDQRGCGENADDKVTFGIKESLDIRAVVKFAREEIKADKVIVHGQSMGAQTVAIYASNVTPGTIEAADAVICDSPVPGMELILKEMFGDGDTDSFLANYLTGTSKAFMKVANGINYDDGDTINVVKNDNIPTMVIVSDKDEVCLPDQVVEIYDNIACDNKAIYHADSAHIEGVIDNPEGYMNSVENFLSGLGI